MDLVKINEKLDEFVSSVVENGTKFKICLIIYGSSTESVLKDYLRDKKYNPLESVGSSQAVLHKILKNSKGKGKNKIYLEIKNNTSKELLEYLDTLVQESFLILENEKIDSLGLSPILAVISIEEYKESKVDSVASYFCNLEVE